MLIEIESLNGDILLSVKVSSVGQLKQRMMDVLDEVGSNDFVAIFCARYGYDIYPYDHNIKVDFIIDLDVHRVYKPAY